jgi:hypothetical protein
MQPSFFLDHVAPYAASSCSAPPGAVLYTTLPHVGYAAPNAAPTHASFSLKLAPPIEEQIKCWNYALEAIIKMLLL